MGVRAPQAVREQRAKALEPLFAQMRLHRMSNRWMAKQLDMPEKRFWAYANGEIRLPPDFITRVCKIVPGLRVRDLAIPEPRDLFIQMPRTASRSASTKSAKSKTTTKKRTATR